MTKTPSLSLADLDRFVAPFRIEDSPRFHLRSQKTNEKGGLDKDEAENILEANRRRLSDFQEKLYAQDRWSVLVVLQGMEAAGKDSTIKHLFEDVNPQGCEVTSFKQPTSHELDHDFLWRHTVALPRRGMIGKLRGVVDQVGEDDLILDVNGVGYLVTASARTLRDNRPHGHAAVNAGSKGRPDGLRHPPGNS